jgi:hypothetical protein
MKFSNFFLRICNIVSSNFMFYKLVNILIQVMISDVAWPKVITLSGAYCTPICIKI